MHLLCCQWIIMGCYWLTITENACLYQNKVQISYSLLVTLIKFNLCWQTNVMPHPPLRSRPASAGKTRPSSAGRERTAGPPVARGNISSVFSVQQWNTNLLNILHKDRTWITFAIFVQNNGVILWNSSQGSCWKRCVIEVVVLTGDMDRPAITYSMEEGT